MASNERRPDNHEEDSLGIEGLVGKLVTSIAQAAPEERAKLAEIVQRRFRKTGLLNYPIAGILLEDMHYIPEIAVTCTKGSMGAHFVLEEHRLKGVIGRDDDMVTRNIQFCLKPIYLDYGQE